MRATGLDDLAGRTAVVTGAGQGIGATIARTLAGAGARVVINGRHDETLNEVCKDIANSGGVALACPGSVTDPLHLEELMTLASGEDAVIDILVNNAGIAGPTAPLAEVKLAQWEETLAVNLTGVFLACQAALPLPPGQPARAHYLHRIGHRQATTVEPHSIRGLETRIGRVGKNSRRRTWPGSYNGQCGVTVAGRQCPAGQGDRLYGGGAEGNSGAAAGRDGSGDPTTAHR